MKRKLLAIILVLLLATQAWAAKSFVLQSTGLLAAATALNTAIAGGTIKIYTTAYGKLLVTITIPAAGSNTPATDGTLTLGAMGAGTAAAGDPDDAAVFRIYDASNNIVATGNVGAGVGFTINLSAVSITTGQTVTITSAVFTIPAGS